MMNTKKLFGIAAIIASTSLLVDSLNNANAYPQGPSVSYVSNPLFTVGGTVSNSTTNLITAPNDQLVVITDVILTMSSTSCASTVELGDGSTTLGSFQLRAYNHLGTYRAAQSEPSSVQHAFNSGIAIASGSTLSISESGSCNVSYTLSGYYAQP